MSKNKKQKKTSSVPAVCSKSLAIIDIDKGIEPGRVAIALRFSADRRTFFFIYHGQRNKY